MNRTTLGLVAYIVFLAGYAWFKYAAAAPPAFEPAYARSVAILVGLTGVPPFLAGLGLAGLLPTGLVARLVAGALVGALVCVGGYALYFKMFIEPNAPDIALFDVARRGIGWGAAQGVIGAFVAAPRAPR